MLAFSSWVGFIKDFLHTQSWNCMRFLARMKHVVICATFSFSCSSESVLWQNIDIFSCFSIIIDDKRWKASVFRFFVSCLYSFNLESILCAWQFSLGRSTFFWGRILNPLLCVVFAFGKRLINTISINSIVRQGKKIIFAYKLLCVCVCHRATDF